MAEIASLPIDQDVSQDDPDSPSAESSAGVRASEQRGTFARRHMECEREAETARPVRRRSMLQAVAAEKHGNGVEGATTAEGARRRARAYKFGQPQFPLLQTTVDELAALETGDAIDNSSASSAFSSSPISSPIPITSTRRANTLQRRTQSYEPSELSMSESAARRSGRQISGRSGSVSESPASQFLSQFIAKNTTVEAEPDDEGQELGENAEYKIGREIARGGFSVVKEVHTFEEGIRVIRAVKIVRKQIDGESELDNDKAQVEFEREVTVWRYCKHEHILPLITVFDTPFATFCITRLNTGGTLYDVVLQYRRQASRAASSFTTTPARSASNLSQMGGSVSGIRKPMPLKMAKRYIYQLATALRYLHEEAGIVHRDIKLENCLVNTEPPITSSVSSLASLKELGPRPCETNPGIILLSDFGMSDWISVDERNADSDSHLTMSSSHRNFDQHRSSTPIFGPGPNSSTSINIAGSLPYASPEQLKSKVPLYQPSVDIWAFGVTCYALLTGGLPFQHAIPSMLVEKIETGEWNMDAVKTAVGSHSTRSHESIASSTEQLKSPAGNPRDGYDYDNDSDVQDALELLHNCLHLDPVTRWSVANVLDCSLLKGGALEYGLVGDNE